MWKPGVLFLLAAALLLAGCKAGIDFKKKEPEQKVAYTICGEKNQPERLKEILERRRKKSCTFAYKNSKYTYLVVCYGAKPYSGYSIKVKKCVKTGGELFLKTQLVGPSAKEEAVETQTYPAIVVRCSRTELLCSIEP